MKIEMVGEEKNRSCGECQACCTMMGIQELGKQEYLRCHHQCEQGCAVYTDRPKSCADFVCFWLLGESYPSDRPDKSGLIIHSPAELTVKLGFPLLIVNECWEGAFSETNGVQLLGLYKQAVPALILVPYGQAQGTGHLWTANADIQRKILGRLNK